MPKVIVTIDENGAVKRDYHGYEGESCLLADEQLRAQLAQYGLSLETIQLTPKPELQVLQHTLTSSLQAEQTIIQEE